MAVDVRLVVPIELSAPAAIVEDTFHGGPGDSHTYFDVMPDGTLVMMEPGADHRGYVNIVVNWVEELKQRIPR